MRKILKLFFNRYYTNGKRTIDILLFCWRKYIDWVYHISFGLFAFNIIMFILRWRLPNWVFISLLDRKSTRLNSSHSAKSRMPSSA